MEPRTNKQNLVAERRLTTYNEFLQRLVDNKARKEAEKKIHESDPNSLLELPV